MVSQPAMLVWYHTISDDNAHLDTQLAISLRGFDCFDHKTEGGTAYSRIINERKATISAEKRVSDSKTWTTPEANSGLRFTKTARGY
jgi:hypothetical protein